MKTIIASSVAAAALALSISSAFAFGNSPQGQVITGGNAPAITSQDNASQGHFLSGAAQTDSDFGLSSNAAQGRDFLNAQKGRY